MRLARVCVCVCDLIHSYAKLIKVMLEIHLITTENAMRRHVQWNWVWSSKLDLFMVLLELAYAFCNISKHLSINIRQASWLSVAVCASNFSNGIRDSKKIAIYLTLNGKIHLNMSRIYIFCIFSTQQKKSPVFTMNQHQFSYSRLMFTQSMWVSLSLTIQNLSNQNEYSNLL